MKIKKINYETGDYTSGCETCDYGSSYITNLSIETNTCKIDFEFDTMYDYISESDLMQLLSVEYDTEWCLINKLKNTFDLESLNVNIDFKDLD